jgi:hypothetical protein
MTNGDIENIDKLFRDGLNPVEDHIPFQESDWSKLEQRLIRNEKRKRGVFWLSRLGVVAALILLFFTIRMLIPEDQKQIIQQAEVQNKELKLKEIQGQTASIPEDQKKLSKIESNSKTLVAQNKLLEKQSPQKPIVVGISKKETLNNDSVNLGNLSIPKTTGQLAESEENKPSLQETSKPTEQKRSIADESLFGPNEKPNLISETEQPVRSLALSVLAAPNYNGVNNLSNASMGNDFGLMVTLDISKNWSLSAGGIYAKKLYETGFKNYSPTKNIWAEYYPKSVNADCRILDIPLNINYKLFRTKNTTISLGSGISSYIMLSEDYRFSYTENNNSNPLSYRVVNENKHWLSVLNFQANFEQRLNSRLSIGLQPYLKIPLSNIGFAGVKLQSIGMAVNLSWNFNL